MADSFTHATHKLSEASRAAIAGLQNMDHPPAYTANDADTESDTDDGSDWRGPPVTVHIDASVTVEGNGNQIALPPHPSSRPLRAVGDNLRAAQGVASDYIGGPNLNLQRLMADRAEQITDAVMQALKDSGVFAGTVTPMRQLDVHVDASVNVKGGKNVLTTNVPVRRNVSGTDPSSPFRTAHELGRDAGSCPLVGELQGGSLMETGRRSADPSNAPEEHTPTDTGARSSILSSVPEGPPTVAQAPLQLDTDTDRDTQTTSNQDSGAGGKERLKTATLNTKRSRTPSPEGGEDEEGEGMGKRVRS